LNTDFGDEPFFLKCNEHHKQNFIPEIKRKRSLKKAAPLRWFYSNHLRGFCVILDQTVDQDLTNPAIAGTAVMNACHAGRVTLTTVEESPNLESRKRRSVAGFSTLTSTHWVDPL
jgi:hypothetical protein